MLIPGQHHVDIFSEIHRLCNENYELCIVEQTLKEVEKLAQTSTGKDKKAASLALKLIKAKDIKILSGKPALVDDILVELARDPDVIVATQDRALKHRIKYPKIVLRQKQYLAFSN